MKISMLNRKQIFQGFSIACFLCLFTAISAQNRTRKFMDVTFEKEAILRMISPTPTFPNHKLAGIMFLIDTASVSRNLQNTSLEACRVEWTTDGHRAIVATADGRHPNTHLPMKGTINKDALVLPENFNGIRNFEFVFFDAATIKSLVTYRGSTGIKLSRIVVDGGTDTPAKYQTLRASPFPQPTLTNDFDAIAFAVGFACPPIWPPNISNGANGTFIQTIEAYKMEKQTAERELTVAPNPAESSVRVFFKQPITVPFVLQIQDISGKVLENHSVPPTESFDKTFDISGFPKGEYFIVIKKEKAVITQKMIKN